MKGKDGSEVVEKERTLEACTLCLQIPEKKKWHREEGLHSLHCCSGGRSNNKWTGVMRSCVLVKCKKKLTCGAHIRWPAEVLTFTETYHLGNLFNKTCWAKWLFEFLLHLRLILGQSWFSNACWMVSSFNYESYCTKTQKTRHIPRKGVLFMYHGGHLQIMWEMCLLCDFTLKLLPGLF